MKSTRARDLWEFAKVVADRYSGKRDRNPGADDFEAEEAIPFSETTAAVIFNKTSGKKMIAFFYFITRKPFNETIAREDLDGHWRYFIPLDTHLLGMIEFTKWKLKVERENYAFNFPQKETRNEHDPETDYLDFPDQINNSKGDEE